MNIKYIIGGILIGILGIFAFQFFLVSKDFSNDAFKGNDTYLSLLQGEVALETQGEEIELKLGKKYPLAVGDKIVTFQDSLALIEWGDKSITRLEENGELVIEELFVDPNQGKINITFDLKSGKTWSNIVSFLVGENHFHQKIDGAVASVRGTVFEADANKKIFGTIKHEVEVLGSWGEKLLIFPGELLGLEKKQIEKRDISKDPDIDQHILWDREYTQELRRYFLSQKENDNTFKTDILTQEGREKISGELKNQDEKQKQATLQELQKLYQEMNFEDGSDENMYDAKIELKKMLVENEDDKEYIKGLLKYSMYDLEDLMNYSPQKVIDTMKFLGKNNDDLELHQRYVENIGEKLLEKQDDFMEDQEIFEQYIEGFEELVATRTQKFELELEKLQSKLDETLKQQDVLIEEVTTNTFQTAEEMTQKCAEGDIEKLDECLEEMNKMIDENTNKTQKIIQQGIDDVNIFVGEVEKEVEKLNEDIEKIKRGK